MACSCFSGVLLSSRLGWTCSFGSNSRYHSWMKSPFRLADCGHPCASCCADTNVHEVVSVTSLLASPYTSWSSSASCQPHLTSRDSAFYLYFWYSHPNECEVVSHFGFEFDLPWWIMMLSILSGVYWPLIRILSTHIFFQFVISLFFFLLLSCNSFLNIHDTSLSSGI